MPPTDTPFHIIKTDRCPAAKPYGVVTKGGGVHGCFPDAKAAQKQLAVLYIKLKNGEIKGELDDGTVLDSAWEMPADQWEEMMAALVDAMIQCPNCGQWFDDTDDDANLEPDESGDQPKCPNCGTQTPARMEPS